jgi:DNA-binding transcriptional LysR family regulator
MDFTALRYFSETAHSRSIRAASERLHVSPSAISRQIDRAFRSHAFQTQVFCVTNSLALVKEVAAVSPQCTLLPRFALEHAAGTLCTIAVREFAADPLVFCICTLNRRSVSPAAKAFSDTVVDYCRHYRR